MNKDERVLKPGEKVKWVVQPMEHFEVGVAYEVKQVYKMLYGEFLHFTVVECKISAQTGSCICTSRTRRKWILNKDFEIVESAPTEEEAMKANTLPTPDDVASFFGVKL